MQNRDLSEPRFVGFFWIIEEIVGLRFTGLLEPRLHDFFELLRKEKHCSSKSALFAFFEGKLQSKRGKSPIELLLLNGASQRRLNGRSLR